MKPVFLTFLASLSCCIATAQSTALDAARMDSLLARTARANKASGIVLLEKKGNILYQRGFGNAVNGATPVPVSPSTTFRIGSISKTFTSAMIFQLIDEKKLSQQEKLSKFFPMIPNADSITIDHLLAHRSGLHNITEDTSFGSLSEHPISQAELLKLISSYASEFAPGKKSEYSNTNYMILGWIVEKLRGTDYATALQKQIAGPLGLKSVRVFDAKSNKDDALSYEWSGGRWNATALTHPSAPGGAGTVAANAMDLARFMDALFAGKVVSGESLKEMQRVNGRLGRGLNPIPWNTRFAWGHGGHIDAFNSSAARFPDDSMTVVILSNGASTSFNDLNIAVLSVMDRAPGYQLPDYDNAKVVTVSEATLDQYVGVYTLPQAQIDIAITRNGATLTAEATGQGSLELTAISKDEFTFEEAGIRIRFAAPVEGKSPRMTLYQGGNTIPLERK